VAVTLISVAIPWRAAPYHAIERGEVVDAGGLFQVLPQSEVTRTDSTPDLTMCANCWSTAASETSVVLFDISGGRTAEKNPNGTFRFAASPGAATAVVSASVSTT
jgi:hypothetical protein